MPARRRHARLALKLFALSWCGGMVILFSGYAALMLLITEPAEFRTGPLNEAMLTA